VGHARAPHRWTGVGGCDGSARAGISDGGHDDPPWQANTFGRYDHPSDHNPAPRDPHFQGYGVQLTDREGRYRFTTIKPGPYPFDATRTRTPHLHFEVTGRVDQRITQLFFAGEPLNAQDFVLQAVPLDRERLIAELRPAPAGEDSASRLIQWDIVLPTG
jgi:protocatechuate 3,4-dioxygenase, beta subunit